MKLSDDNHFFGGNEIVCGKFIEINSRSNRSVSIIFSVPTYEMISGFNRFGNQSSDELSANVVNGKRDIFAVFQAEVDFRFGVIPRNEERIRIIAFKDIIKFRNIVVSDSRNIGSISGSFGIAFETGPENISDSSFVIDKNI